MATATAPSYPVTFDVQYPESLNRWLIFVKWLLVIPHILVLFGLALAVGVTAFIAWFGIFFTGRYPRGLHGFAVDVNRWAARVNAYMNLLRDEYPPFGFEAPYPVELHVEYPPYFAPWRLWLTGFVLIPHFIVLFFYYLAYMVTLFIAFFAILITGRYPRGLFNFGVGVTRYSTRVGAYASLLCTGYPPFSMQP